MKRLDVGRLELGLVPGTERVVYLHDIAGPVDARTARMTVAEDCGAWVVVQAGHAGSDWRRGGVYDVPGFAIDLLSMVVALGLDDVVLVASGASRYVASCIAQAAPDLVSGIDLLPGEGGWADAPARGPRSRDWVSGITMPPTGGPLRCQGDDPALSLGPPEALTDAAVETWTADLAATWWTCGDTPAGFPPDLRVSLPHWPKTVQLRAAC